MIHATIKNSIGVLALTAMSACASQGVHEPQADVVEQCKPPNTLTCDRFAGENYNCSCERGTKLKDILDSY